MPEILNAYGVQSPFQVVERVCASDLGGTVPNVVRLKTMAEQGKKILDIVAANTTIWPGSDQPLFFDPLLVAAGGGAGMGLAGPLPGPFPVDIQPDVERRLISSVEQWLAVNGIKEITQPSASIPTISSDGAGGPLDQLRQMISAGQAPSLDQLKALMPDGSGMVRV